MSKSKRNDENQNPSMKVKSKSIKYKKQKNSVFKFDMNKILKQRQADAVLMEKNAEMDEQLKVIDDLFQKEINEINAIPKINKNTFLPKLDYVIFDYSKYNTYFKDNSNSISTKLFLQQLISMSIEQNELEAHITHNYLKQENWSLVLDDIKAVLCNWGADLHNLGSKLPKKCLVNDYGKINRHNFELVINFISHNILINEGLNSDDLLTLAKIAITISFDHHCGQMLSAIKNLFSICLNKVLREDDGIGIISFAQELYSTYKKSDLLRIVIDLFLPLENQVMKKIYSYLTFKLYKSLLGKTNNINPYPSSINDWFVQEFVDKNYFKNNHQKVLEHVIQLLEHVVIIFDLYKNEEKLSNMYDFLISVARPNGWSHNLRFVNILDQWRLQLFSLFVDHQMV